MLAAVMPRARIMRYGYESQWFGDDAIRQKASTVAQRLLLSLERKKKVYPLPLSVVPYSVYSRIGMASSPSDLHRALFWRNGDPQGPFYVRRE